METSILGLKSFRHFLYPKTNTVRHSSCSPTRAKKLWTHTNRKIELLGNCVLSTSLISDDASLMPASDWCPRKITRLLKIIFWVKTKFWQILTNSWDKPKSLQEKLFKTYCFKEKIIVAEYCWRCLPFLAVTPLLLFPLMSLCVFHWFL